jgi:hypothetical protein
MYFARRSVDTVILEIPQQLKHSFEKDTVLFSERERGRSITVPNKEDINDNGTSSEHPPLSHTHVFPWTSSWFILRAWHS